MNTLAWARYYNPISAVGAAITTVAAVLFLFFFFLDVAGFHSNPYLGIVTFLMLPALFVLGLLLIPLGLWRERRRIASGRTAARQWPSIDLGVPHVRHVALVVLVLTGVNIAIVALASFTAVEYADSRTFCTGACHTPMEPQSVANLSSVHAAVSCAQCHIGPGAPGFVKAKWGGVRQLAGVVRNSYPRPIPSPVHDLPAAVGTCLACHTATAHIGDVVHQIRTYADDEIATESLTTLTMRVGGGNAAGPQIHWHANPANRIEYIDTDEKRETIPWVQVTTAGGEVREYTADGVTPAQLAAGERRIMDCTDCHNRLGHPIAPSAERAIDDALAQGRLPKTLPFIRREAVAAVRDGDRERALAERQIAEHLGAFYARHDPKLAGDARVRQAILAAQQVYAANVFPAMKVKWGTYPNQQGHTEVPGCFRCHDEAHKARDGKVISQDCATCHEVS